METKRIAVIGASGVGRTTLSQAIAVLNTHSGMIVYCPPEMEEELIQFKTEHQMDFTIHCGIPPEIANEHMGLTEFKPKRLLKEMAIAPLHPNHFFTPPETRAERRKQSRKYKK